MIGRLVGWGGGWWTGMAITFACRPQSMLSLTRAGSESCSCHLPQSSSIALAACSIFTEQKALFGSDGKVQFLLISLRANKPDGLKIVQRCYNFSSSFY